MGSCSSVAWTRPPRWDPQAVAAWFSCFELGPLYLISLLRWGAGTVLGEPGLTGALRLTLTGTAAVGSMSYSWEDGICRGAQTLHTTLGHSHSMWNHLWVTGALSLCLRGGKCVMSPVGSIWGKGSACRKSLLSHRTPQGHGWRLYLLPGFS